MMRLLLLPDNIVQSVNNGELSMGHARALLGLKKKEMIQTVVKKIKREQLNVRQVEQLITELNKGKSKKKKKKEEKDIYIKQYEVKFREALGTNVKIYKGKHKGKIEIDFYSDEDLEQMLNLLK